MDSEYPFNFNTFGVHMDAECTCVTLAQKGQRQAHHCPDPNGPNGVELCTCCPHCTSTCAAKITIK
jgi:hypothetical protein